MSRHLATYAEGWTKGDVETILRAATADYVYDDPVAGKVTRDGFHAFFADLRRTVEAERGSAAHETFMDLTEVVTSEETNGELTAWCWWAIPGTRLEGAGLIKVGPNGVRSERIAHYAPKGS